jgi:hypothetical protein
MEDVQAEYFSKLKRKTNATSMQLLLEQQGD